MRRTGEQFAALSREGRLELVRGEVVAQPPPGFRHGEVAVNAGCLLHAHVRAHRLGKVVIGSGFYLHRGPDTVRCPAVSFYPTDRVPPKG